MSGSNKFGDWDTLWNEYTKSLEKWKEVFESFQKMTQEMQTKYNQVIEKASTESSKTTMEEFGQNWQKAMNDAGAKSLTQFNENWQKAMSDYGAQAFKNFGQSWEQSVNESGMDTIKAYGEMMNKFAETWKKMWRT